MEKENRPELALASVSGDVTKKSKRPLSTLRATPYLDSVIMEKLRLTVSILSVEKRKEHATFH